MECEKVCPLMEDLEESIACQVCFNRMEKPKTLTCLHSFCLVCIMDMRLREDGLLCCPICREHTMVSPYENNFENIFVVQGLTHRMLLFQIRTVTQQALGLKSQQHSFLQKYNNSNFGKDK